MIEYDAIVHEARASVLENRPTTPEEQKQIQEVLQKESKNNTQTIRPSNFYITDNQLGNGTAKEKYQRNVDAIRLLKQLESRSIGRLIGMNRKFSRSMLDGEVLLMHLTKENLIGRMNIKN